MQQLRYGIALFLGMLCNIYAQHNSLVAVTIMIKNEAASIAATLEPLYGAGVRDFLVYDTGSTDGTQHCVQEFFQQHTDCVHYLIEEPFVDFSTSRNRALDLAETYFPHVVFDLMPDAEWFLHDGAGFMAWCAAHVKDTQPVYLLKIANADTAFYTARLLRRSAHPRFEGVVHEQLTIPAEVRLPDAIWFEYAPSAQGARNTFQRWHRDLNLLLDYHAKHSDHARTLFYIGQTYGALGQYEKAYEFYEKRTHVEGFIEESFLARYRMGIIAEYFDACEQKKSPFIGEECWWDRALCHYLDAFSYRPIRIEPLVKIATHYWHAKEYALAYLFARRACEMEYPKDYFCVEKVMYDFDRYDLLGVAATAVGKYGEALWALDRALAIKPEAEHLYKNKQLCKKLMQGELRCR